MSTIRSGMLRFVSTRSRSLTALAFATIVGLAGAAVVAQRAPADAREQAWRANNIGVAHLEQFNYAPAAEQFRRALALDGTLTAARVNLAISHFYATDLEAARREAEAVSALPDGPPHADYLLGLIARADNREADAIAAFRRVLADDDSDVGALVNLGQLLLQQRAYGEAVTVFARAVELEPYNVSALYNLAVAHTRNGNRAAGSEITARFQVLRESGYGTTYSNTYLEQGRYAEAIISTGAEGGLVARDVPTMTFEPARTTLDDYTDVVGLTAGDVDRDGFTDLVLVTDATVYLLRNDQGTVRPAADEATLAMPGLGARGAAMADIDNDGAPDLVVHGRDGLRLWRQGSQARFVDVTVPSSVSSQLDVHAVALVDLDHDGDLDIVAGGDSRTGAAAPLEVWRNNGDGTFVEIGATALPAQQPSRVRQIVAADVDLRRDIDVLVRTHDGGIRLWRNMRDGSFADASEAMGLTSLPAATAFAVGDLNKDGYPDLFVSTPTGPSLVALGSSTGRVTARPADTLPGDATTALLLDADNDGLLDVVAGTAGGLRVARNVGDGWQQVGGATTQAQPLSAAVALDVDGSGVLDLVALSDGRVRMRPAQGVTHPGVRVRLTGQVSNRTGVGAKVEMRAGSLWQKVETAVSSPMAAPADIVFGLGTRASVDVIRVLWPAGIVQAEVQSDEAARTVEVIELDRKPSSCPYLFTWNGERFEFVSDFLGGGEMGYQLAPGVFNVPDPEEYVRIRGDQLVARGGDFELRVTNELEETLFLDHFALVAVDHPAGVEVHPREGLFAPPFPGFTLFAARDGRLPVSARGARGQDVLDALRSVDRRYVADLPLLPVRGYAALHDLVLDLGPTVPDDTLLLLTGWTDYAFSSDNIAASQAGYPLQPPSLQVKDPTGAWQTVVDEVGIPVGRPQTVVVDLSGKFLSDSREVRIRTSMRIYWDAAKVASRDTGDAPVTTRLAPREATLQWRGFSAIDSPEEPLTFDYAQVTPHSPWKQMPGRYTREGDVRELLLEADDRFVVARPGDEVALHFDASALPGLAEGWTRTFLLHSHGFSKEMDINSASPDHAWPLPHRGMTAYPERVETFATTPGDVERERDEPEWVRRYNTRVVGRQVPRLAGVAP